MPRISVVVPVYNVEPYLAACLGSIAEQTFEDLDVILVDDGSTDGSMAVAQRFLDEDPRFRLITQPNGGLGSARNTGAAAATGEFLAFVDSDDVLPQNAYELLAGSLDATGSDFATGNVHRLTQVGTAQAPFLAATFSFNRPATHVSKFRPLLADRIAPNKLWRRSFWDRHGFRFPEGMLHEDIPVVIPAQFAARSVDVIADPVYYYRIRAGDDLSITQRRAELQALSDRMKAVESASDYLRANRYRRGRRWYDASVVADDLRYYINVLDSADEEYRAFFLERVNAFLERVPRRTFSTLPAIERLQWYLVRRHLLPELLEVLRFQREDLKESQGVEIGRRWYGDYPFRGDPRLKIPLSVYRLGPELAVEARLDALRLRDGRLEFEGSAYINAVGADSPRTQRVRLAVVRRGRAQRIRQRVAAVGLRTRTVERRDATASTRQAVADVTWSGFAATFRPRRLRLGGRWREGTWDLFAIVRAGRVTRRTTRFVIDPHRPVAAIELPVADPDVVARVAPTGWRGRVAIEVRRHWATVGAMRPDGDGIELAGQIRWPGGDPPSLELARRGDGKRVRRRLQAEGGGFSARLTPEKLRATPTTAVGAAGAGADEPVVWELFAARGAQREPVALGPGITVGEHGLVRNRRGAAALLEQTPALVVTGARWSADSELELEGTSLPGADRQEELVLSVRDREERYGFAIARDPDGGGGFSARLTPARIESMAGGLPLREGIWDLYSLPAGRNAEPAPVLLDAGMFDRIPLSTVVDHKPLSLGVTRDHCAVLVSQIDLDDDERGLYHQRRLREQAYRGHRGEPLQDTVVYSSFSGRQYSDSPRAIHEELVRRDAPLEHLWVVRDHGCEIPPGARVLREGSREHHEALARARFVVANDHFPDWFARRPDQVCVQTWHGTPLKRLGLDVSETRKTVRRFQHRWDQQVGNWQYVVSPNRFSTPILRRAYAIEGEMLETGFPRDDILVGADRDSVAARVRARLGVPDGVRTVLYAPTYRDHVVDRRGRYRLDLQLDLERLRSAVGPDTVILFRKHHYIADAVPESADGFVRDVSSYPDGTELLLAADVLVTDYSSIMFDFANTGRPMLFFTYDLEAYADEIRGFYLDFVDTVPGPLLRTTDEVADALGDLDRSGAAYAERYKAFLARFCEHDDGRASARVVDRVFSW